MMLDEKGAFLYAAQLYNLLTADDPAMVLGNPITRAVLISLAKDLLQGRDIGGDLRERVDDLRVLIDGGELFVKDQPPASDAARLTDQERWMVCSCLVAHSGANMGIALSALRKLEGVDKVVTVETQRAGPCPREDLEELP